MAFLKIVQLLI